jgi:hypothetical protein
MANFNLPQTLLNPSPSLLGTASLSTPISHTDLILVDNHAPSLNSVISVGTITLVPQPTGGRPSTGWVYPRRQV